MDGITIDQIVQFLSWAAGGITASGVVYKFIGKGFHKALQSELEPMNEKLDKMSAKQDEASLERAENFVTILLARVERGEDVDNDELRCFWKNYKLYESLGGNDYVHGKVERLKKQGKLS